MSEFIVSCCSPADLPKEYLEKRNIQYCCFHYELGDKAYRDDLGVSMPLDKFYQAMVDGAMTKTSQMNSEEYIEYFEKFLQAGKDVIHLTLSSGISGTYNSARIAKEELEEKYPDRKLYVIDSLAASSGFGLLTDKLADLRDEGMGVDDVAAWIEEHKLELNHWFFSADLTFFIRGGRISKTAGFVGNVLNICPFMNVDYEGRLIVLSKIRTKKKVIREAYNKMVECAEGGLDYSGKCFISNAACREDAEALAKLIEENFHNLDGKVMINDIGTTIGSHTGPGTTALFFWGNKRVD